MTEEEHAWLRTTPETDPGKKLVRRLQRELDDLRRMHLGEPFPRTEAEGFVQRTAHRDFSG